MNNDIDHILMTRRAVDVPEGLAQRIINMATPHKRKEERWIDIWSDIQAMFVIPRPAYALAMAVVIGLFVGLGDGALNDTVSDADLTSFLSAASADFDEGNWL